MAITMAGSVVVIGSSNVDFIIKTARLPEEGETVSDGKFAQSYGGKGANQAITAARLGAATWFVGCVGDDPFGSTMKKNFRKTGICIDHVATSDNPTGAALIMIGNEGRNLVAVAPGANHALSPEMVRAAATPIRHADMVIVQFEIRPKTLHASIDLAGDAGVPVLFNCAPVRPLDRLLLSRVDYLVINETEVEALSGMSAATVGEAREAALVLLENGPGTVIVTLGANGVLAVSGETDFHMPAFRVEAVDTTAAGDVFCGAVAVSLVGGAGLRDAVGFAQAASALSVTRLGAQTSIPTRKEVEEFLLYAESET
jgi:ribokinase